MIQDTHKRPPRPFRSAPALVAALLGPIAAGCDGCPSSKPYTPYTLGSSLPSGAPEAPPGGEAPDGGAAPDAGAPDASAPPPFATVAGAPPPPDGGKRWPLEGGGAADAPAGRTFESGLVLDADGDGARDLVAWARAPDGLRGELRFAPGGKPGAASTIAALPGDLGAQGCLPRASLAQIGPATLVFDFAPQCAQLDIWGSGSPDGALRPKPRTRGEATRWLAILRLRRAAPGEVAAPELVLELRVRASVHAWGSGSGQAGPPPQTPRADEALAIELDAADRDGDGRDDLAASLVLSGSPRPLPPSPDARAPIVFFDRPAGLSRDPSQPGEALRALAGALLAQARAKATAPAVGPAAQKLRRLHALLCAEGGDPLVATGAGPLRCGAPELAAAIDHAEAVAASTAGDPVAAVAALVLGGAKRNKDGERLLAKLAPAATAAVIHRAAAAPQAAPGWGPLAFEASGDLLVRTADGVVRVDRTGFAESPAGVAPWPSAIVAGGAELAGVERRCDRPTLVALVRQSAEAAEPMEVPLPALGSRWGERCAATARVPFAPLGASDGAIAFGLGPALFTLDLRAAAPVAGAAPFPLAGAPGPAPGAARSPDGATLAVPAAGGLLVATAKGPMRLWSGEGIGDAAGCAPANGGARVACLAAGAAVIYEAK